MKRNYGIELAKIILALMVVGLHANIFSDYNPAANFFLVNGMFRVAVPLFYLINGYYFFAVVSYPMLKLWLKKTFLLYLFWMVVYSYFWIKNTEGEYISFLESVELLVIGYHHLWYISGMVGAGVLTYFLRKKTNIGILLAIFFYLIGVTLQCIHNGVCDVVSFNIESNNYYRNFLLFSFPFFYIGYAFNKFKIHEKIRKSRVYMLLFIAVAIYMLELAFVFNVSNMAVNNDIYVSLIFICPFAFILLLKGKATIESAHFSNLSTAIYLVHPLCLLIMKKLGVFDSLVVVVGTTLLAIFLSFTLIYIKKRSKLSFIL